MENRKAGKVIILAAFVVIICMSNILWIIAKRFVDTSNHENRLMAERPHLTLDSYSTFSRDFNSYFNDNLQFRKQLVTLDSAVDYYIFDRSANKEVIKGKAGWLFYTDTLADYQRNNLYTEEELQSILDDVLLTKEYFDEKGIEFVIFIGPNKNTIYGEYMPSYIETYGDISRVQQMVDYLKQNTDVKIIFPVEELLTAKKEHPELQNYFHLDTHWNYMGGFWASAPLLESLGVSPISIDEIKYEQMNEPDFIWYGYDEANMIGLSAFLNSDVNYRVSSAMIDSVQFSGDIHTDSTVYSEAVRAYSDAYDRRKVFLIRDSFGEAISPYIAASFGEMYSRYKNTLRLSEFDEEKPDIVVFEVVERKDFPGMFDYRNWEHD